MPLHYECHCINHEWSTIDYYCSLIHCQHQRIHNESIVSLRIAERSPLTADCSSLVKPLPINHQVKQNLTAFDRAIASFRVNAIATLELSSIQANV